MTDFAANLREKAAILIRAADALDELASNGLNPPKRRASAPIQPRKKRKRKMKIPANMVTKADWAKALGVSIHTIEKRLGQGQMPAPDQPGKAGRPHLWKKATLTEHLGAAGDVKRLLQQ